MQRNVLPPLLVALAVLSPATASADTLDFAFLPAIRQADPTGLPLMDITRAGQRLVVVGELGVIAVSDDDGASWQQADVPVSTTLTAVDFAGDQQGWVAGHGGVVLHTTDGGLHWQLQFDGNQANRQFLAYAHQRVDSLEKQLSEMAGSEAEDDLAYALEDAEFAVEDAEAAVETGPVDPFLDLLMLDSDYGFAVGAYGMFYLTRDGGKQWQLHLDGISNPDRYHYYGIATDSRGILYLAGEAGLLYHSTDRGLTWQRNEHVYDGSLFGALALDNSAIIHGLRGHVFRSEDGGESWQASNTGVESGLYGALVIEGSREILIVGAGGQLLRSSDGGRHFKASNHPSRSTFAAGIAADNGDLLLVGMDGLTRIPAESADE